MLKPKKSWKEKELVVFDLDGTLTESKSDLEAWMSRLLCKLLQKKKVAVIGGGSYKQFQKQFLAKLKCPPLLKKHLFLFPTTSTSFYRYKNGGWRNVYTENLKPRQKRKIFRAFEYAFTKIGYKHPQKVYGKIIEDRGTQITFSALGQKAPVKLKERWNKENDVRQKIMREMRKNLPEFEVRSGGLTSVDVTKKGIDKAYGVRQIRNHLHIPVKKMLFVGDALYPGGNDAAARKTGIECLQVSGPKEAAKFVYFLLKN